MLLWKTGLPSLGDFEISLGDSFPFFGRQVTFLWERDFPSPKEKCRATWTISRASKRKDGRGRTPRPSVYAAKSAVFSAFYPSVRLVARQFGASSADGRTRCVAIGRAEFVGLRPRGENCRVAFRILPVIISLIFKSSFRT